MKRFEKNIIFMGTPEFAVPTLELLNKELGVKAVVTVPDKPKGRGKKMQSSDVKIKAEELSIPVLQPEKLKDENFIEQLKSYEPDIICILAFRILPEEVYSLAKIASFNIHGSLLPAYRGAAPINWVIINGEKTSGLTSFILEKKVDTGNILLQHQFDIPAYTTAGELHDMMMPMAAQMSIDTCKLLNEGNYKLIPQDDSKASPAPKIFPEMCEINWDKGTRTTINFINGMSPFPGAWTTWNGERLKILKAKFESDLISYPGEFMIEKDKFIVQCADGLLSILELQLPGKKKSKIEDFLNGYRGVRSGNFGNS